MEINPPPLRIPETLRTTEDRLAYFEQLHEFLRLLWERTGGREDLVDTSSNLSRRVYTAESEGVVAIQNSRSLDIEEQPEVICRPVIDDASARPDPSASGLAIDNERRITAIEDEKTQAGYGAIRQTLSPALSDITVDFQTLPADAGSSGTGQRGITAIPANDSLRFDEPGIWLLNISLALDFTEAQQGRTFDIRAYNLTDDTVGRVIPIAVGRNQAGVNWSAGILVDIDIDSTGGEFRMEIGNASATIVGVTLISYSFDAVRVSEKRE